VPIGEPIEAALLQPNGSEVRTRSRKETEDRVERAEPDENGDERKAE
jgi:hypothetical protein